MISEFRWVRIKRKSGSILLDNQHHWICRDWANFTSKAYSSYAAAGEAADAHVAKYPAHADKVSVFYCEKSSCQ